MAYNGLLLYKALGELGKFRGYSLRQIYQSGKNNFYFRFQGGTFQISVNPRYPFAFMRKGNDREPSTDSPFLKILRGKLNGAILAGINQPALDRVFELRFHKRTPFGELEDYRLFVELIGPASNIVLTDGELKILSLHKKRITEKRTLLAGSRYTFPEKEGIDILNINWEEFLKYLEKRNFISSEIKVLGFDRRSLEALFSSLAIGNNQRISLDEAKMLYEGLKAVRKSIENTRVYYMNAEEKPWISAFYLPGAKEMELSTAIDELIEAKRKKEEFKAVKNTIQRHLNKEIKRLQKLIDKLTEEISSLADYEKYRKIGQLLTANLYRLKEKKESIWIEDWESGEKIQIKLDPRLTPSENAKMFFRYYNRSKRKVLAVENRLKKLKSLFEYYLDLRELFEIASSSEDLEALKGELEEIGILKKKHAKRRKIHASSGPKSFTFRGFRYLVGRNNIQNDQIRREAAADDLWFHARNIPGAHVILKAGGKRPGDEEIKFGAFLAATHSKGKLSGKVEVDYTNVKNVWKPKGAHPGMVLYKNYQTLVIDSGEGDFHAES
ncbi:hypothetical protein AT15_07160 [Kosmotoga arenicorallina S304]|uniref:NFACT protein RNA binding domain-containing protein n=1 Tax=Kosmotoga arenicorallina S304 TaxID=1453497 RepID=A0A182C746_9BACT|nr:NFACT family protein [Kosmotoga arenicorallina]OAA31267.1 hypothetical protein AT15_07160 [Kosmotoga arenicorallina S304]